MELYLHSLNTSSWHGTWLMTGTSVSYLGFGTEKGNNLKTKRGKFSFSLCGRVRNATLLKQEISDTWKCVADVNI